MFVERAALRARGATIDAWHLGLPGAAPAAADGVGAPSGTGGAPPASADGTPRTEPAWLGPQPPPSPSRVVSLAPSLTDTVLALGEGTRLVGVTRYDLAPEVKDLPRVGGFLDPSPEAVLGLRPDLVLLWGDGSPTAQRELLSRLGLPVLSLEQHSLADVAASLERLGTVFGTEPVAHAAAESLRREIEALRLRYQGERRIRVFYQVWSLPLYTHGGRHVASEMLRVCGAENVVRGTRPWPVYPLEKAVAADPDLVVDAAVLEPAAGVSRLAAIPAVRRGAVVRLASDDLIRPGPRMVGALAGLLRALHPEAAR